MSRIATFWAGGLLLGLDVAFVEEMLVDQVVTPVPLAPPGVLGLLNLRGRLVTAVDASHRLGLRRTGAGGGAAHLIIRTPHEAVSLVVDRAGEVLPLEVGGRQDVPSIIDEHLRELIEGAYDVGGELLLVLDADRVVSEVHG